MSAAPQPPRVLVTREQLEPLGRMLRERGLQPVHGPASVLEATGAAPPVEQPAELLVSSAAAARLQPDLAGWAGAARVVAVGRATAASLEALGLQVEAVGKGGGDLALGLLRSTQPVFVGARRPAPAVRAALERGLLLHWAVYDRRDTGARLSAAARAPLAAVLLASPSAARCWARWRPSPVRHTPVVVIGRTTAEAADALGLPLGAVAAEPGLEALAEAAACMLRDGDREGAGGRH